MGQGKAELGRRRRGGGDAWHDLHIDAAATQELGLLARAAEDRGIAALQTHHPQPPLGKAQHQPADGLLAHAGAAGALADLDLETARRRQGDDLLADQGVIEHRLRALDHPQGPDGQQVHRARPCADQKHLSRFRRHERSPCVWRRP